METDVRQLRKSFYMALLWLLLILAVAVGATYAWFTGAGRASTYVTPTGGTISEGDTSLLISKNHGGPFDKKCELPTGKTDTLKPLSTADLKHFYKTTTQNKKGISILFANADGRMEQDAVHGTVYLKCENASCDVYFNKKELNLGNNAQALAAMRLGLRITSSAGTSTRVFKLDGLKGASGVKSKATIARRNAVVSSVSAGGQPVFVKDPGKAITTYMAQTGKSENEYNRGVDSLVQLKAGEIATVEYWLYLEGCDEQCYNPVQNIASQIRLAFAGVDVAKK